MDFLPPDIVTTIRKLRKYIGPEDNPTNKDTEKEWKEKSERIRIKSDAVFHKIQVRFDYNNYFLKGRTLTAKNTLIF